MIENKNIKTLLLISKFIIIFGLIIVIFSIGVFLIYSLLQFTIFPLIIIPFLVSLLLLLYRGWKKVDELKNKD